MGDEGNLHVARSERRRRVGYSLTACLPAQSVQLRVICSADLTDLDLTGRCIKSHCASTWVDLNCRDPYKIRLDLYKTNSE